MQSNTRHFEYVLDFMLQNGSKECLKITSLLPLMYAIAALPDSSNQNNFFLNPNLPYLDFSYKV